MTEPATTFRDFSSAFAFHGFKMLPSIADRPNRLHPRIERIEIHPRGTGIVFGVYNPIDRCPAGKSARIIRSIESWTTRPFPARTSVGRSQPSGRLPTGSRGGPERHRGVGGATSYGVPNGPSGAAKSLKKDADPLSRPVAFNGPPQQSNLRRRRRSGTRLFWRVSAFSMALGGPG